MKTLDGWRVWEGVRGCSHGEFQFYTLAQIARKVVGISRFHAIFFSIQDFESLSQVSALALVGNIHYFTSI